MNATTATLHNLLLASEAGGTVATSTAVALLYRSGDDMGLQSYVCKLLRRCPSWEVEYYLPQLCHLLVARPDKSASLQACLVELCTRSMHSAVCVLWFLDAYLDDLHNDRTNPAFALCVQLYQRCHAVLFPSLPPQPPPATVATDTIPVGHAPSNGEDKPDVASLARSGSGGGITAPVRTHTTKGDTRAIVLGMGVILAAIAMPGLVPAMSDVVLDHARSMQIIDAGEPPGPESEERRPSRGCSSAGDDPGMAIPINAPVPSPGAKSHGMHTRPLSLEELYDGRAFSFNQFVRSSAGTSPAQARVHSPPSRNPSDISQALLNPHYFHSELQFIMTLVDIGDRLVSVHKSAREATLKAQLRLLSHNLPARVCIPLWCPATREHPSHHVVVRVAPEEAVVLNSKARVPYLIHVEVVDASEPLQSIGAPDFDDLSALGSPPTLPSNDTQTSLTEDNHNKANRITRDQSSRGPLSELLVSSQDGLIPITSLNALGHLPSPPVLSATEASERDLSSMGQDQIPTSANNTSSSNYDTQLRTASVMLTQLSMQEIASGPSPDTVEIRSRILREIQETQGARLLKKRTAFDSDEHLTDIHRNEEDPSAHLFLEDFDLKTERIRKSSPWGHYPSWRLLSVIVKCRDDLRQEQLACQMIAEFRRIWSSAGLPLFVYPFRVLVTSRSSGLVETIPNAVSVHSIKKNAYTTRLPFSGTEYTLKDHFAQEFGPTDSPRYRAAQNRFAASLAGYSLVCYFLQLKDRHDGNILLDREGRLIHIDFGFMLSNSPGRVKFETAPFKMSQEYIDVLGGLDSDMFDAFQLMFYQGFLALRRQADSLILLLEIMQHSSKLPCFVAGGAQVATSFVERFRRDLTDEQLEEYAESLLGDSCANLSTMLYDQYQYYTNGIL